MDPNYSLHQQMLGLMLITLIVWVMMFIRRLGYMNTHNIDANQMRAPQDTAALIPAEVNAPAHHLGNLSELPILFYAICLLLTQLSAVDNTYSMLAWGFVIFRALQAAIHLSVNRVMWRFSTYLLASLCLWAMVIRATLDLL